MKRVVLAELVGINLGLAIMLVAQLARPGAAPLLRNENAVSGATTKKAPKEASKEISTAPPTAHVTTPFESVYSAHATAFVANLRQAGCPEETIKDILIAEMQRRYHAQEETLRPKPADHVPWGWSSRTVESKLLERRHQAAAIAREKESTLRDALGYEVHVPIPLYAMSTSDRKFQNTVDQLAPKVQPAALQTQEQYWNQVEQLRARTKGFWEPSDVKELEQLKRDRAEALERLKQTAP